MDLSEFLRARFADDEQAARAASIRAAAWPAGGTWHLEGVEHYVVGDEEVFCHQHNVTHIVRHDPARVLAEVESKRRIVDGPNGGTGPDHHDEWVETLRLLALPFADHPDYDGSWRP